MSLVCVPRSARQTPPAATGPRFDGGWQGSCGWSAERCSGLPSCSSVSMWMHQERKPVCGKPVVFKKPGCLTNSYRSAMSSSFIQHKSRLSLAAVDIGMISCCRKHRLRSKMKVRLKSSL